MGRTVLLSVLCVLSGGVFLSAQIDPRQMAGIPRPVTGVAIWDDVNPDANRFSIFVSGLSNGWSLAEDPADPKKQVVRRKTLQLNFKRMGDRYYQTSEAIKFVPPIEWVYRATSVRVAGVNAPEKPGDGAKK